MLNVERRACQRAGHDNAERTATLLSEMQGQHQLQQEHMEQTAALHAEIQNVREQLQREHVGRTATLHAEMQGAQTSLRGIVHSEEAHARELHREFSDADDARLEFLRECVIEQGAHTALREEYDEVFHECQECERYEDEYYWEVEEYRHLQEVTKEAFCEAADGVGEPEWSDQPPRGTTARWCTRFGPRSAVARC